MAVFAVTYLYSAEPDELNLIRPSHRAWLGERLAEGTLLASGPMVNNPTALLIWRGESVEALATLLNDDPFDIAGYIGERTITEWNPVFGPWGA